jgi:phosphoribosylglycinamide formyltransferase-1
MNLAVFVSGNGSNLQVIMDAISQNKLPNIQIGMVVADRACYALDRAMIANIPTIQVDRKSHWHVDIELVLREKLVSHIMLAGFLSVLPSEICLQWKNRIVNIHPSLLPKYGGKGMFGMHVHQSVINNREKESGATIHYVTDILDEGEILIQRKCTVDEYETPFSLQKKIQLIEHEIIIESLNILYGNA